MKQTIIKDGILILEDKVLHGHAMVLENDRIAAILPETEVKEAGAQTISAQGCYIMAGILDIHSDMIENFIQPRSTALMDFEMALREAEKVILMSGITTMFHSISMYRDGTWDVKEIRKAPQVKRFAHLLRQYKEEPHLIRHRYHLRYEIDNLSCYDDVCQMVEDGLVDLISFMDHSPGQGQYKNLAIYRKHLPDEGKNLTDQDFDRLVHREQTKELADFSQLKALSDLAASKSISVASHDDDTVEKLQVNKKLHVTISEFPITLEVARAAVKEGFLTVLGAPNILLGGSHSGNLSAWEAIQAGAASILVSDYYPQSLLQAVFRLHKQEGFSLPDAAALVTINPAKAVGLDSELGSLTEGKRADFLIVDGSGHFPVLRQVFVDGVQVLDCRYRGKGLPLARRRKEKE